MGVSAREYARMRGVSHVAVLKALKTGRISKDPDGTIDPARANASWEAESDPARKRAPKPPTAPVRAPAPIPPPAGPSPQTAGTSFTQARTLHEIAKAQRARLQVDRLKEEVVDRARASALVFKLARQERDAWVNWPGRVAALMAADLGIDPHTLQKTLETHVRAHLAELADVAPDLR
jgi:hypothetical protein